MNIIETNQITAPEVVITTNEVVDEHAQKPIIQYDDFAKIDIRVGTIIAAEEVPETDKLLKCTIDFGPLGTRTIVSGIKAWRSPESVIGLQVPYVVNLAPKKIKGIESQGMLFALGFDNSDGSEGFAFLHPDSVVPNGVKGR